MGESGSVLRFQERVTEHDALIAVPVRMPGTIFVGRK